MKKILIIILTFISLIGNSQNIWSKDQSNYRYKLYELLLKNSTTTETYDTIRVRNSLAGDVLKFNNGTYINTQESDPTYISDSSFIKTGMRGWDSSLAKTIDAADTTYWGIYKTSATSYRNGYLDSTDWESFAARRVVSISYSPNTHQFLWGSVQNYDGGIDGNTSSYTTLPVASLANPYGLLDSASFRKFSNTNSLRGKVTLNAGWNWVTIPTLDNVNYNPVCETYNSNNDECGNKIEYTTQEVSRFRVWVYAVCTCNWIVTK